MIDHHGLHAFERRVIDRLDAQREAVRRRIERAAARLVKRNDAVLGRVREGELVTPVFAELLEVAARGCGRDGGLRCRA
jgi:hypothetical protein